MQTTTQKWSSGRENKLYIYNFREIKDPHKFLPYKTPEGEAALIELDPCPFCSAVGIVNSDCRGSYGECSVCGAEGPHYADWVTAAKMWNSRSFKEFAEARGTTAKEEIERLKARGFDINRITDYNKGALKWT